LHLGSLSDLIVCMTWSISLPLLVACFLAVSQAQTRIPSNQRTLIVISLDGFPAYALEDPKLPVPTLRRLMREGSSARRMTPINPTVTWPNHTGMVTGVHAAAHGLLVNGSLVPTESWPPVKIDASIDKTSMVRVPTIYDLAQRAGLTTAEIDWVAINRAPTITWHFPELASPEGPLEREMIEHGVVSREDVDQFSKSNILLRDEIWAKAAVYLVRQHKPNLLLLHFLTLDSIHHRYGPKSLAG
jgi:predicted AlkP superfamily pyrophosphatase or phosphodiesterase